MHLLAVIKVVTAIIYIMTQLGRTVDGEPHEALIDSIVVKNRFHPVLTRTFYEFSTRITEVFMTCQFEDDFLAFAGFSNSK